MDTSHHALEGPGRPWKAMTAIKPETGSSLTGYWGSDNSQHVNFIGLDGHVHELYILPGADWVDNDLTALATAQSPAVQSGLSGYWQSDNSVHVFYNGAGTDNHVYQLRIAADWFTISGRGRVAAIEAIEGFNPRTLEGKTVKIDGKPYLVLGVEAHALKDVTGHDFGLLVGEQ
jgi:hypothetical protein